MRTRHPAKASASWAFPERDVLVVEAALPEAVGSNESGAETVRRYLSELACILRCMPLRDPAVHLSPKFGFSGWLPLRNRSAIHLYAWDEAGLPTDPFVSVDVSVPEPLSHSAVIVAHLAAFFGAEAGRVVFKTLRNKGGSNSESWHELAHHILRQRLHISGDLLVPIADEQLRAWLFDLCSELEMVQISEPLLMKDTDMVSAGWMHWETSGAIVEWSDLEFAADIYTCKAFFPEKAIVLSKSALGLRNVRAVEF